MTNVISALTARTQLGQIMKRASEKSERFLVDRRGQPSVIIMSVKDYIDTFAPTRDWLKQIGAEAKRKGDQPVFEVSSEMDRQRISL